MPWISVFLLKAPYSPAKQRTKFLGYIDVFFSPVRQLDHLIFFFKPKIIGTWPIPVHLGGAPIRPDVIQLYPFFRRSFSGIFSSVTKSEPVWFAGSSRSEDKVQPAVRLAPRCAAEERSPGARRFSMLPRYLTSLLSTEVRLLHVYFLKGTGRARAGSIRSPLFKGGGAAHGPKPRDYSFKLPKKVRERKKKKKQARCCVVRVGSRGTGAATRAAVRDRDEARTGEALHHQVHAPAAAQDPRDTQTPHAAGASTLRTIALYPSNICIACSVVCSSGRAFWSSTVPQWTRILSAPLATSRYSSPCIMHIFFKATI